MKGAKMRLCKKTLHRRVSISHNKSFHHKRSVQLFWLVLLIYWQKVGSTLNLLGVHVKMRPVKWPLITPMIVRAEVR